MMHWVATQITLFYKDFFLPNFSFASTKVRGQRGTSSFDAIKTRTLSAYNWKYAFVTVQFTSLILMHIFRQALAFGQLTSSDTWGSAFSFSEGWYTGRNSSSELRIVFQGYACVVFNFTLGSTEREKEIYKWEHHMVDPMSKSLCPKDIKRLECQQGSLLLPKMEFFIKADIWGWSFL